MKYVVYRRPTDLNWRQITETEWLSVGILHPNVVWNRANGWRVPRSDISDEAFRHIELDAGFYVEGEDDDAGTPVPEPKVRGTDKASNKRGGS